MKIKLKYKNNIAGSFRQIHLRDLQLITLGKTRNVNKFF